MHLHGHMNVKSPKWPSPSGSSPWHPKVQQVANVEMMKYGRNDRRTIQELMKEVPTSSKV